MPTDRDSPLEERLKDRELRRAEFLRRAQESEGLGMRPSHEHLEQGYLAFSKAILPKYPLSELSAQNITDASAGLTVWEESVGEISENYFFQYQGPPKNLVNEMIPALEYVIAHPGVLDLDLGPLQTRCTEFRKTLYKKLLNDYIGSNNFPDVPSAIPKLITEIEKTLLDPGSHNLSSYMEDFRKILGLLEVSQQVKKESPAANVLNRVLLSSFIPHFDHLKTVYDILSQSDALADDSGTAYATRLSGAGDPGLLTEFSRTSILKAIEDTEIASRKRDFLTLQKMVAFFETMPGTDHEAILQPIKNTLHESAWAVHKLNIGQEDLARHLFTTTQTIFSTIKERALRKSFYSSESTPSPQTIQVIFEDASTSNGSSYKKHMDLRTWQPITVEANPHEPMEALLLRFSAQANCAFRHPFYPVSDFDFHVVSDGETETVLRFGKNWFTQGSVGEIIGRSTLISYIRHDEAKVPEEKPPLRMIEPFQRQYPASAPQPPEHWITTPKVKGPWRELLSLQFMGDGVELTANSTYPPLIARTLLLPSDYKVITTNSFVLRRLRIAPTLLQEKLTFPLTVEQARSLLGRTIYYHSADPDSGKSAPRRAVVNKRRKVEEEDPVYLAYVWGLDPDARIIKTLEYAGEDSGELCRTFQFDDSGAPLPVDLQPESLPSDYPALRKVARFDWVGLVELPMPVGPTKEEIAAKEELERMRARFNAILEAAPPLFEVGIGGDRALVVGELNLHPPGSHGTVTVEGCKAGIWESGYEERQDDDADFLIWVRWAKAGVIDLDAPATAFAREEGEDPQPLDADLMWENEGMISVDGGVAGILARGILGDRPMVSLTGESTSDMREAYLEILMLSGSEDGRYHVPGGISSYTGGDGSFYVQVSRDEEGDVVALRVTGNGGVDEDEEA